MKKFKLYVGDSVIEPDISKFPGGEIKVTIPQIELLRGKEVRIEALLFSSDDVMALVMIDSALTHGGCRGMRLTMPYIPYARQDRICNAGEAFSLKAFAKIINSLNLASVVVYDAHSSVSTRLIDRCINIPPEDLMVKSEVNDWISARSYISKPIYLVSPDAGSIEKCKAIKNKFPQIRGIVFASKERDPLTGNIIKTVVNDIPEDIESAYLLVCDDICDGGRTFIELAKALKAFKPLQMALHVTHGIFSKGMDVLSDFDDVFCMVDFKKGLA